MDVGLTVARIVDEAPSKHNKKVYLLTGREKLNGIKVAEEMRQISNKDVDFEQVSEKEVRDYLLKERVPPKMVEYLLEIYQDVTQGKADTLSNDVKIITGREPELLLDYLKDVASRFKWTWEIKLCSLTINILK